MGELTALLIEDLGEAQGASLFNLLNSFKSPLIWPKYAETILGQGREAPAHPLSSDSKSAQGLLTNLTLWSHYSEPYGIFKGQIIGTSFPNPPSLSTLGGDPRVVVNTAAFHARARGSYPDFGGLKETKMFLPHPLLKLNCGEHP